MTLSLSIENNSSHPLLLLHQHQSEKSFPNTLSILIPSYTTLHSVPVTLPAHIIHTTANSIILTLSTPPLPLPTSSTTALLLNPISTPSGPRPVHISPTTTTTTISLTIMPDLTTTLPTPPPQTSLHPTRNNLLLDTIPIATRTPRETCIAVLDPLDATLQTVAKFPKHHQQALIDFLNMQPANTVILATGLTSSSARTERAFSRLGVPPTAWKSHNRPDGFTIIAQVGGLALLNPEQTSFNLPIVVGEQVAARSDILGGLFKHHLRLSVSSAGSDDGDHSDIRVEDRDVFSYPTRHIRLSRGVKMAAVHEATGRVLSLQSFDVRFARQRRLLVRYLHSLPTGRLVLTALRTDASALDEACRRAMECLGSRFVRKIARRDSWCMIGQVGAAPGSVREEYRPARTGCVSILADVPAQIDSPVVISVRSAGTRVGNKATLYIGGRRIDQFPNADGLNCAVVTPQGAVAHLETFDTMRDRNASAAFANWLVDLPIGTCVAIAGRNDAGKMLTVRAHDALRGVGARLAESVSSMDSYAVVGFRGAAVGTVAERLSERDACRAVHHLVPETGEVEASGFSICASSGRDGAFVAIDGARVDGIKAGLNVVLIDDEGCVSHTCSYDVGVESTSELLADMVEKLPVGQLTAVTMSGYAPRRLTPRCKRALSSLGSRSVYDLCFNTSWLVIGRKGSAPGSSHEHHAISQSVSLSTWIPTPSTAHRRITDISAEVSSITPGCVIKCNGVALGKKTSGVTIGVFEEATGAVREFKTFDVYFHPDQAGQVLPLVHSGAGCVIAVAVQDDPSRKLPGPRAGSANARRSNWSFVGRASDIRHAIATGLVSKSVYRLLPDAHSANSAMRSTRKECITLRCTQHAARMTIFDRTLAAPERPCVHVAVIDAAGSVQSEDVFETQGGDGSGLEMLADVIESVGENCVVAITAPGCVTEGGWMDERCRRAIRSLGGLLIDRVVGEGGAWAIVGWVGCPVGAAAEVALNGVLTLSVQVEVAGREDEVGVEREGDGVEWKTKVGALWIRCASFLTGLHLFI